jgi:monoamine oxidase
MIGRTPLFRRLLDSLRSAGDAPKTSESKRGARVDRRQALKAGAAAVAIGGCAIEGEETARTWQPLRAVDANIGVVGAGIAGIACAYELARAGARATVHEAGDRIGGRIWSSTDAAWLGQSIERGGELIDTGHKTMLGWARMLGLEVEEVTKPALPTLYHLDGALVSEASLVDEYRVLVDAMREDLRTIGAPTAAAHTPAERALDLVSLEEWLVRKRAPSKIAKLLRIAYTIEYGVAPSAMSCLSFLLFAKASRQSKLRLFGNFSDERYHVIGGNQQIPIGLAARLPGPIALGRRLTAVRKLSDGRIELTFVEGGRTVTARHDAVVLAIPFHLLRGVTFDRSVGLPAGKSAAIAKVVYGANSKLMLGFRGRPWIEQGSSGASYSDRPYLQATWETNPKRANDTRSVITDYTGDALARALSPTRAQQHAADFLRDFDVVLPGAAARARRDDRGRYVCHLEQWSTNPLAQGGYTANQPGYFTEIAGHEATPVGNVYFAGETTDSFYSWQGFMEGGALSGLRAAREIVRDFG